MISYSIYTTPENDYITCSISNNKILIVADSITSRAKIMDMTDVKDNRYINISPERFNKLVHKVIRKVLCTL